MSSDNNNSGYSKTQFGSQKESGDALCREYLLNYRTRPSTSLYPFFFYLKNTYFNKEQEIKPCQCQHTCAKAKEGKKL